MFRRHVWNLILRVLLLLIAAYMCFTDSEELDFTTLPRMDFSGVFLCAVWVILVVGMLLRIIPNKRVAIGARKHYARSFSAAPSSGNDTVDAVIKRERLHKGALISAVAWVVLNAAVFIVLSLAGILTQAAIVIIMLIYAVCDTVCILFFCPFQVFFMRNRCCAVCRIHNWDYIMMCTPMVLVPSVYSYSLVLLSAAVVLYWEIALRRNPYYFMEETNENLSCAQCDDKLCHLRSNETTG